jgi:hypothetical protein
MRYWQVLTAQPSIETYMHHVLFESSGVSADPEQQSPLGRLSDNGVKRTASSQIFMGKMPATWIGSMP